MTQQSYSDPWKEKLFKQPPTPSEITSFQTPPPLGISVALRWGWGGGHEYFRELHIAFLWSKMDQKQVKLNRSAAKNYLQLCQIHRQQQRHHLLAQQL